MTLHHLGNGSQGFNNTVEIGRVLEKKANEGTGFITQRFGVKDKLRTFDNTQLNESAYTLMNGSARNMTCTGYLQKGYACIVGNHRQNLSVKSIKFTHRV